MPVITLIRHAESQANRDGVWHGRGDGPLSAEGEESLQALRRRLEGTRFDLVVSSPLHRARETASAFSDTFEVWEDLTEIDVGEWEGRAFEEVRAGHAEALRRALTTRTTPMGGTGETLAEAGERAWRTLGRITGMLPDDGHAAVVTHGGLIQTILHRHLAGRGRRVHAFTSNTALTRLAWRHGRYRLAIFNDTGHLGPRSNLVEDHLGRGDAVLALIRHGRTRANVEGRWQGHGDWALDEVGEVQARALGQFYGKHRTVYSSPLQRARATALQVAENGVVPVDDLKELAMGNWEGLTGDEIMRRWPDLMARIYRDGIDLKRGETGESWGELTNRFRNAVHSLTPDRDRPTVVVAHGGAIRSYVSGLTMTDDTHGESLFTPDNTSVTHVALTAEGPVLLDYSVATHLESAT